MAPARAALAQMLENTDHRESPSRAGAGDLAAWTTDRELTVAATVESTLTPGCRLKGPRYLGFPTVSHGWSRHEA